MLNIISLIFGMGAWGMAVIAIAKPAYYNKSVILSFALCTFSLIFEFFQISRRVNLGDYAAIEDTIRAVIIASIVLMVLTIILNIVALVKSKKKVQEACYEQN